MKPKAGIKGMTLIEVMILVGLISVVSAAVFTVAQQFLQMQTLTNRRMIALRLKEEFRKIITNQGSWDKTISDVSLNPDSNAKFACLRNGSDCFGISSTVPVYPFVPKTISDQLYGNQYDPRNPIHGFSSDGTFCKTFVAPPGPPTSNCEFRFTFLWAPDCSGYALGQCLKPRIVVKINFTHNPLPGTIVLSNNFNDANSVGEIFARGYDYDTNALNTMCAAYGPGTTYDSSTKRCLQSPIPTPFPIPVPNPIPIPTLVPGPVVYLPVPAPFPVPVPPAPPPCTGSVCSDIRVKKEVQSFNLGLSEILKIRPVQFKYNGLGGSLADEQIRFGVLAQDLEKVAPSLVVEKEGPLHAGDTVPTSIMTVNYEAFPMMLINAIQELNRRVEYLENENAMLRNKKTR